MRITAFLITAAALTFLAVPSAAMPAVASNPVPYPANDTSPDTAGAPDISSVIVSDNPNGLITVQISLVPGSYQYSSDSFNVFIDSDQNPTTGDPQGPGTEYQVQLDGTDNSFGLFKWDGKSAYYLVDSKSVSGNFAGDSAYLVFAASELGITDGFNFFAAAAVGSNPGASSQIDYIPENGANLHYSLQSKLAIKLKITDSEYTTPHAGKLFEHASLVTRSDTGAALGSDGKVTCALNVRGKPVPVIENRVENVPWYKGGSKMAAVCIWRIPPGSVGATLIGKETVTLGTSSVSKVFTYQVRK